MRGLLIAGFCVLSTAAHADEPVTYELTLKDAAFDKSEIKVPAGKPFILKLNNQNSKPAELEAKDMKVEKAAAGNSTIVVRVKAMEPGKYLVVDEYQEEVAKTYVIVE